jgi:hypothetical protein
MLEPINCETSLYSKDSEILKKSATPLSNFEAIRSVGASVLALWSKEEIGNTGWKTGKSIIMFSLLTFIRLQTTLMQSFII